MEEEEGGKAGRRWVWGGEERLNLVNICQVLELNVLGLQEDGQGVDIGLCGSRD